MENNGFKLLAIRPLKGTSSELLKGLKENFLYQFYNEYHFLDKNGNNIINDGKHVEVRSILYSPTVPIDLYGKNINISAIVGQNGSGKSTLLEILYYAILLLDKNEFTYKLEIEIILLKNDFINIIYINNQDNTISVYRKYIEDNVIKYKKSNDDLSKKLVSSDDFSFYTNVLNYSIYGLNSKIMPWVDKIFNKNDAYQLPIVISPFKNNGNYDINTEYMLMQSRAVFYAYALGVKEIIESIYIHNIYFEIDINKILKLEKNKSTYESLEIFIDENISEIDYNDIVFKGKKKEIVKIKDIRNYITNDEKNIKDFYSSHLENINLYKSFTYLYIFKKLNKIASTYNIYNKYSVLYLDDSPFEFNFKDISYFIENHLSSGISDKTNIEIIYETLVGFLDLVPKENSKVSENDLFYLKELFMGFYRVDNKNIHRHLSKIKYQENNILNNIESIKVLVKNLFSEKEFRKYVFQDYINKLDQDQSHITFKLKQAINYFKLDLFNHIETKVSTVLKNNEKDYKIKLYIDRNYFIDRKQIEDIPLAVFDHIIEVVKTKEQNESIRDKLINNGELIPYPYNSLSSGEQHLMNSILTIAYHNYNLLSVKGGDGLKKYKNINLIFDELELYLHPEYQRRYVKNLLEMLSKIREITNQYEISYNIMMVTHSPFILSDIPSQNILKLENGEPKPNDNINSFAANIYDLLNDEFFLKNGAVGAYSQNYINTIIYKIEKINPDTDKKIINELKIKIAIIGDELIRYGLEEHLFEKLKSPEFEIELLKERIKNLEAKNVIDEKN